MMRPSYRAVRVVLLLAFAVAVFGIGGVFKEVIVITALSATLAFSLAVFRRRRVSIDSFGLLLITITLFTWLQTVPLPFSALEWLTPNTAEVLRRGALARGLSVPTSAPLSLDPESTSLGIVWWIAVTATYLATRQLQTRRDEQTPVLTAIPVFGLVILLSGLVHALLGETALYGLYEPEIAEDSLNSGALFRSVFLNPNHLAAFLNGGLAISLAWAGATHATGRERILWYVSYVLLALGVLLTNSRAGVLTGIFASLVILVAGRKRYNLATCFAVLSVMLTVTLILPTGEQLLSVAGIDGWASTTHHDAHMLGWEISQRWSSTGIGRGAFGPAHTLVGPDSHHYLTHVHNTPLQFVIDYGWFIGGGILLAALSLLSQPFLRSIRAPLGLGVCAALLALATHNLVDFSFDILGVALMAAILAASLRNSVTGFKLHWLIGWTLSIVAIVIVFWLNAAVGPEAGPRRESIVLDAPTQALSQYPTDAYAFLSAGLENHDAGLVRHAAWLHPQEPRIHLALAALGDANERSASIRNALSTVRSYKYVAPAFTLIRRTARTTREILDSLPSDDFTARYLTWLSPTSTALLKAAIDKYPESTDVLSAAGMKYLKSGLLTQADDMATRLILLDDKTGYKLMGKVFLAKEKPLRAYHMFIAAADIQSRIRAAEIALDGGLPQRALVALDKAGAEPRYLKKIQSLRAQAESDLTAAKTEPISALDVFRAPLSDENTSPERAVSP